MNALIVFSAGVLFYYLFLTRGEEGSGIFWSFLVPVSTPFFLGFGKGLIISILYPVGLILLIAMPDGVFPLIDRYSTAIMARFLGVYVMCGFISLVYEYNRDKDRRALLVEIAARKENEDRFRQVFSDSPDAYLVVDDGIIIDSNSAAQAMMRGTITGMTAERLSPEFQPDQRRSADAAPEIMEHAGRVGEAHFEWVYQRLDGEPFWAEVSVSATRMKNKRLLLVCLRDIEQRKKTEEKMIRINDELERGNKLMSAREDRILELKQEINTLYRELGREPVYQRFDGNR